MIESRHSNDDLNLKGIIYCIRNLANGKMYIGQSNGSFNTRYNHDVANNTHSYKLKKDIKQYGEDSFEIIIIASGIQDEVLLDILEFILIKKFDLLNSKKGYNLIDGGKTFLCFDDNFILFSKIISPLEEQMEKINNFFKNDEVKNAAKCIFRYMYRYIERNRGILCESIEGLYHRINKFKYLKFINDVSKLETILFLLIKSEVLYMEGYLDKPYVYFSTVPIYPNDILRLKEFSKPIAYTESACIDLGLSEYQHMVLETRPHNFDYDKASKLLIVLKQNIVLNDYMWVQSYEMITKIYNLRHPRRRISETETKKLAHILQELQLIRIYEDRNHEKDCFVLDISYEQKFIAKYICSVPR